MLHPRRTPAKKCAIICLPGVALNNENCVPLPRGVEYRCQSTHAHAEYAIHNTQYTIHNTQYTIHNTQIVRCLLLTAEVDLYTQRSKPITRREAKLLSGVIQSSETAKASDFGKAVACVHVISSVSDTWHVS